MPCVVVWLTDVRVVALVVRCVWRVWTVESPRPQLALAPYWLHVVVGIGSDDG